MTTNTTHIELLAPAKDLECGIAAIDCGADALYVGAAQFGARERAGNSLATIGTLTRYAHRYRAKVYVTVNTLLHDDEVSQAQNLAKQLYDLGVDGLIIQDAALLEVDLPPLPLIASTQMHNITPKRVAFLEQVGVQRAILARELSLDDMRAIRAAAPTIELEAFVHGALCVCYSGQCYLSYAQGGRSGNRGQCAQPCRKCYDLQDAGGETLIRGKHFLSLRDLNQSDHLADLIQAGICSFKIEGRLKDITYVKNVVGAYRQRLDAVLAELGLRKSSSGEVTLDFTPDLAKTFNRGYTTYFLNGRGEPIAAHDTPKMVGEPVGTIHAVRGEQRVIVETTQPLHNGDGICFFDPAGIQRGAQVNLVDGGTLLVTSSMGMTPGTELFRNHDHAFHTALAKAETERRIAVRFTLRETPDGFSLLVEDEDGVTASAQIAGDKALAEKPERVTETIHKQLAKTGDTNYRCAEITVDLPAAYFLPVSTLNALRRDALEALDDAREATRPRPTGGAIRNQIPYPVRALTFEGNVLNRHAAAFYRRHGVTDIERGAESRLVNLRDSKVMTTRYCLKDQLGWCPKQGNPPRHAEPLFLVDEDGRQLELRFDCGRCEMGVILKS